FPTRRPSYFPAAITPMPFITFYLHLALLLHVGHYGLAQIPHPPFPWPPLGELRGYTQFASCVARKKSTHGGFQSHGPPLHHKVGHFPHHRSHRALPCQELRH